MNYDRFRALATRLIVNFGNGQEAIFRRTHKEWVTTPEAGDVMITRQVFRAKVVVTRPNRSRETEAVHGWDVSFMVPSGFEPEAGDELELPNRPNEKFIVVAPVEKIAPDGVPIAFRCNARRGI